MMVELQLERRGSESYILQPENRKIIRTDKMPRYNGRNAGTTKAMLAVRY